MQKRRFRDRVSVERKVLGLVNGCAAVATPLLGITEAAVAKFIYTNALNPDMRMIRLLREISLKTDLRVDCSKDSFDGDELRMSAAVDEAIFALQTEIEMLPITQKSSSLPPSVKSF